jgi:hypothetical protein
MQKPGTARDIAETSKKRKHLRDKRKETFWRKHVEAQKISGLSKRGYCKANNLSESSLNSWGRELALRAREKLPPTSALLHSSPQKAVNPFVSIRLLPDAPVPALEQPVFDKLSEKPQIEILVPGGAVIRVNEHCNAAFVSELFSLLKF